MSNTVFLQNVSGLKQDHLIETMVKNFPEAGVHPREVVEKAGIGIVLRTN